MPDAAKSSTARAPASRDTATRAPPYASSNSPRSSPAARSSTTRDKESLFLALAEEDALRMAGVVAEQGLVQVMRNLLAEPPGSAAGATDADRHPADWLGTRLEVSRRLRTDPDFRRRWAERSQRLTTATRQRLLRQREAGKLRDDVDVDLLTSFLELVMEGLVSHLAMGLPADDLEPVLDLVEETVRRHRGACGAPGEPASPG